MSRHNYQSATMRLSRSVACEALIWARGESIARKFETGYIRNQWVYNRAISELCRNALASRMEAAEYLDAQLTALINRACARIVW